MYVSAISYIGKVSPSPRAELKLMHGFCGRTRCDDARADLLFPSLARAQERVEVFIWLLAFAERVI